LYSTAKKEISRSKAQELCFIKAVQGLILILYQNWHQKSMLGFEQKVNWWNDVIGELSIRILTNFLSTQLIL